MGIHAKVLEAYREHWKKGPLPRGETLESLEWVLYMFMKRDGSHRNYLMFLNMAKDQSGKARPIHERVDALYRHQNPADKKEYIKYHATLQSEDFMGNPIENSWSNRGYYELPRFRGETQQNGRTVQVVETDEVVSTTPVWEIEWTPKNIKDLQKGYWEGGRKEGGTRWYIVDNTDDRKFSCAREEWETMPREELLTKLRPKPK